MGRRVLGIALLASIGCGNSGPEDATGSSEVGDEDSMGTSAQSGTDPTSTSADTTSSGPTTPSTTGATSTPETGTATATSGSETSTSEDGTETSGLETSGGVEPTYAPFYMADCDEGMLGARAVGPDALEWVFGDEDPSVVYSDAQAVDDQGQSCRSLGFAGQNSFGGSYVSVGEAIGEGDDVWMRHALYFPDGFCFGYGTTSGDGWGATKWMRIEFDNGGPQGAPGDRFTLQLGNMADNGCSPTSELYGATREFGEQASLRPPNPTALTTGRWHMVQWQVHLATDESGFVRFWIDDAYQGQVDGVTMSAAQNEIDFIAYGDYWNGSPYQDIEWFLDEVIMTTDPPNTLDDGGRPYIDPATRVDDFGGA